MTTESLPPFATVRRGYEPTQVDSYVRQLLSQLEYSRSQADDLARSLEQAERARAESARASDEEGDSQGLTGASAFAGLGARIEQMLVLAEEEAAQLRADASVEAAQQRKLTEEAAHKQRVEAERYAEELRSDADAQGARTIEDARQQADRIRDDADRDAAVRREEAEALFESQRAKVAEAAADFEMTLADRRQRAELEFTERTAAAEERALEVELHAEQLRSESEYVKAEAERKAARLLEAAETQANELVSEAKIRAERIRTESERELVAATQRRDSINAQLTNVRRMLATLGGAALPGGLADIVGVDEEPEPAADVPAQAEAPVATGADVVAKETPVIDLRSNGNVSSKA